MIKAIFGNSNPSLVNASIAGNTLTLDYHDTATGYTDITILGISNGLLVQDTFRVTLTASSGGGGGGSGGGGGGGSTNNPPVVAVAIPDRSVNEGDTFSLSVVGNFSDPDGDGLTLITSALPGWLTFNPTTRTFSGTPGNSNVGTTAITVTANDGKQGSVSDRFDLTVVDRPNGSFTLENATFSVNEAAGKLAVTVRPHG